MKTIKLTLALLAFMIGINSCASIIGSSKDIMMSVQKGMTQKEVSSILGKPQYRRFDQETEQWEYVKLVAGGNLSTVTTSIVIDFVNGRVVGMNSFNTAPHPPVAVYPAIEVGDGTASSRPHVSGGRGMNERDFQSLYNKVKSKPFKDDQLELLEAGIGNRGLSCKQCVRMMLIYRFDDDKLEVLKIIAPNISDRENYDEIIDALDFISSEEKARNILGIKK